MNRSRFACQGSPLLCAQNVILLGVLAQMSYDYPKEAETGGEQVQG